jgi:hypothetical protein
MIKLLEKEVVIKCRKEDLNVIKQIKEGAQSK